MRNLSIRMPVICVVVLFFFAWGCENGEPEAEKRLPSEIQSAVDDSVTSILFDGKFTSREQMSSTRDNITAGLMDSVINDPDSLGDKEYLIYAELLGWSGKDKEAREIFMSYGDREGENAHYALSCLIDMEAENGDFRRAEDLVSEYRERFCRDQKSRPGMYKTLEKLSGIFNDAGYPEDAAGVIIEELNSLECVYPNSSYYLIQELMPLMLEIDRKTEYLDMALSTRDDLEQSLESHIDTMTYNDTLTIDDDDVRWRYETLIGRYDSVVDQVKLVGERTPAIDPLHVYNADSTFSLSSLKGKVVILDFWSACCVPCRVGYKQMRGLLGEYQDQGLEVVGVTCFLGMFPGVETEKTPGGRSKKLDRKREIELNASYIEEYNITWPCLMSEMNVFDKEYSLSLIPTMVLLDRDMRVRYVLTGIESYPQLNRMVQKLL
ncbi:MAG TPA: TlpA disulfide reductase family protein [Candidatus Krumholzibacteriaceae bacterium]|nr:TlpA disulfide reductase family protein [Candidatus Krumholzibacteriaceae bacterium]